MKDIQKIKQRLIALEIMLNHLKSTHLRVRQLKKLVYVLKSVLSNSKLMYSPYGPSTLVGKYSLN